MCVAEGASVRVYSVALGNFYINRLFRKSSYFIRKQFNINIRNINGDVERGE